MHYASYCLKTVYASSILSLCSVLLPALPEFPLGSSLPCWRPSPPPTSSSHGRRRRHAQWAVRHAATRWSTGRWGEKTLAASRWFQLWCRMDMLARTQFMYTESETGQTHIHMHTNEKHMCNTDTLKCQILKQIENKYRIWRLNIQSMVYPNLKAILIKQISSHW